MSHQAIEFWFTAADLTDHSPTETAVGALLAKMAKPDGTGVYPSQFTIAAMLCMTVKTVAKALKGMEEKGSITRGDQGLVSTIPYQKRPVVWDLNMKRIRPYEATPEGRREADRLRDNAKYAGKSATSEAQPEVAAQNYRGNLPPSKQEFSPVILGSFRGNSETFPPAEMGDNRKDERSTEGTDEPQTTATIILASEHRNPSEAQRLVSEYADWCPRRPPRETLRSINSQVEKLFAEDYSYDEIAAGVRLWHESPMDSPTKIPQYLHRALNRNVNGHRPSTTDARVADAHALQRHFLEPVPSLEESKTSPSAYALARNATSRWSRSS